MSTRAAVLAFVPVLFAAGLSVARAQTPAAPPPPAPVQPWLVKASAGLSLASGNTNTSAFNATYDLTYDPKRDNVVKSDGLFLYGKTEHVVSANRLGFNVRDEYRLAPHIGVFAQNQYLRDTFKNIEYLEAPTGGVALMIADTANTKAEIDAGAGGVWERDTGLATTSSAALTVGEKLTQAISKTASLSEGFLGLWKTVDFGDALYTFSAGVAAAVASHVQIKVELQDVFKNKTPTPAIKKNDVTLLAALVFKVGP